MSVHSLAYEHGGASDTNNEVKLVNQVKIVSQVKLVKLMPLHCIKGLSE